MASVPLLINKNLVQQFRPTARLDDARIEPFIREAQDIALMSVLTPALHYNVLTNQTTQANIDLISGKAYLVNGQTVEYPGLKPFLCYEALIRFVKSNPINISRFGIVKKNVEQSENVSPQELKIFLDDLKNTAGFYSGQITKFLDNNRSSYPLYSSSESQRKFSLKISKI